MKKAEIISELTTVGTANEIALSLVAKLSSGETAKIAEQAFIAGVDATDVANNSIGEDDYPAAVLENAKAYLLERINALYI